MKKMIFNSLLVLVCAGVYADACTASGQAFANDGTAVASTYTAKCRFERPLDTYESCDEFSCAGNTARECAEDEALGQCKDEYNSDCVIVDIQYTTIISEDFIGYKACEAHVTVHGFRLNN
jgi:hypothetical protein